MESKFNNEVFKQMVRAGKRTYFLTVKESKNKKYYLQIQESRKVDYGFERDNILIFEEDFGGFSLAIDKVKEFLISSSTSNVAKTT